MTRTEYSWMETEELLMFVVNNKKKTPMEVELAQRLALAQDMITELESLQYGNNARGPRQERSS